MVTIARFSGVVYPDKSFSLGSYPLAKIKREDAQYERAHRTLDLPDSQALEDWYTGTNSIEGECSFLRDAPLFIKSSKSSRDLRGSYGSHGITGFGKKFVKNTSLLLERRYSKNRLGFVTCTLPSFHEDLHHKINGAWGELCRRFYQKLKRQLKKVNQEFIYVGVTEIQEKRLRSTGIPAPHLHFVYVCRSKPRSAYYLYVCQIHRAWNEAIRETIAYVGYPFTMTDEIPWGSVHCKRVKKSVAAYLGKYISKGTQVLAEMKDAGWIEFPKQWWTACVRCKEMFKQALIHLTSDECSALFYGCEAYYATGELLYIYRIYITHSERTMCVGLYGVMNDKMYAIFNTV